MEENYHGEGFRMAVPVILSGIPADIDLAGITIDMNKPFINAYRIASRYPAVKIVEGFVLIRNEQDILIPVPHVWNQIHDCYFDVTGAKKQEEKTDVNAGTQNYFSVKSHTIGSIQNKDAFTFSFSTTQHIAAVNDFIYSQQVIKHLPCN